MRVTWAQHHRRHYTLHAQQQAVSTRARTRAPHTHYAGGDGRHGGRVGANALWRGNANIPTAIAPPLSEEAGISTSCIWCSL